MKPTIKESEHWRSTLAPTVGVGLIALIAVVAIAIVWLNPPRQDVEALGLFLALSGVVSLLIGYLAVRLGWRLAWAVFG